MIDTTEEDRRTERMKVLMALAFYPRGGAAQVVRYLAQALTDAGHEVRIVSGSLKGQEPTHDAMQFFDGLPVVEVDYTDAARGFAEGLNPMSDRFGTPFHPSYEDKPDVPDRVFYRVTRSEMEHLVNSWERVLAQATADFQPDVAHLHHLNHMHIAALRLPALAGVAKIAHLHGTELKMLDPTESPGDVPARQRRMWSEALKQAASKMGQHVAVSSDNVERAIRVLGVAEEKIALIPNGVNTGLFSPLDWDPRQKLAQLETLLVNSPHAWDESGAVGSIRYERSDLGSFLDSSGNMKPLLVFVGRFLGFKRVPLLLDAVARANRQLTRNGDDESRFNLLVLGGVPGEWEGEHPHTAAMRLGLRNVFFAGWLSHRELAKALNVADAFVAPSYFEPFGQVFLEAMATGLPVLATRSGGPLSFVNSEGPLANGWLCAVDDPDSLAHVIVLSVSSVPERQRRGQNALELVRSEYAWATIARRFEALYRQLQAMKAVQA